MKKFISFITMFIYLLFFNFSLVVAAQEPPPKVSADGAVLMDATTGKILYSKNQDIPYPPASTTKILTALLTLEKCNLNDEVTVGKKPPMADGSKIYIFEGEKIKIKDLLYALLLASANDCAEALAEHIGGSIENFSNMMNTRAKELGCTHSNFVNPSGLYDKNHKTSAKDLALIMSELVKHPEFKEISTACSYTIAPTNKCKEARPLWNHNKLVQKGSKYAYPDCEGGKTGYTVQSEHSYVISANKNNQRLIVALIHDKEKTFFEDSVNLLNYGYNNFKLEKLFSKNHIVTKYKLSDKKTINLLAKEDFYYVKNLNKTDFTPNYNLYLKENLKNKSFSKGDIVAEYTISYNDSTLGNLELYSDSTYISKIPLTNNNNNLNKFLLLLIIPIILLIKLFKNKKIN